MTTGGHWSARQRRQRLAVAAVVVAAVAATLAPTPSALAGSDAAGRRSPFASAPSSLSLVIVWRGAAARMALAAAAAAPGTRRRIVRPPLAQRARTANAGRSVSSSAPN